jgi:predicted ATPase
VILPLIGRASLLSAIDQTLDSGVLLTLRGPPGVGKTSLARAAASSMPSTFIEVAHASDVGGFLYAVQKALGLNTEGPSAGSSSSKALGDFLATRGQHLYVFDNLEQLADEVAPILQQWALAASEARFLCTSRCALAVSAERVIDVEPLSLPKGPDVASIAQSDAGALLMRRMAQLSPGSSIAERDAGDVCVLLQRLAGLPLAIELAAVRLCSLDAKQILSHFMDVLRSPEASLEATIETSYSLLNDDAKAVFAQLSVFAGDFDFTAAEAVVRCTRPLIEVLDLLVRASLLGVAANRRFVMLPALRAYAAKRLSDPSAVERHAHHYSRISAQGYEDALEGLHHGYRLLDAEFHEIATAFEHVRTGVASRAYGADLGLAMTFVLLGSGAAKRFVAVADWTLRQGAPSRRHAMLSIYHGLGAFVLGDLTECSRDFDAALSAAKDDDTLARVHLARGDVARFMHRLSESEASYGQALACAERARVRRCLVEAHLKLGTVWRRQDKISESEASLLRAMELARRFDFPLLEAEILTQQALVAKQRGIRGPAKSILEEAIEICRTHNQAWQEAYAHDELSRLALDDNDLVEAERRARAAVEISRAHGYLAFEVDSLGMLATAADLQGEAVTADRRFSLCLSTARRAGSPEREVFWSLVQLALTGRPASDRLLSTLDVTKLDEEGRVILAIVRCEDREALLASIPTSFSIAWAIVRRGLRDEPASKELVVGRDGSWMVPPGTQKRVDLGTRKQLSRLLFVLATKRTESPNIPVDALTLIAHVWPDEPLDAHSGKVRLHTAISALRRLGLHAMLRRSSRGYLLRADVPCRFDPET